MKVITKKNFVAILCGPVITCSTVSKLAYALLVLGLQEELNRGKPNWEHLNDELHVLITVEDTENRATMKMQRAVEEVKKLLIPVVSGFQLSASFSWQPVFD
jgi:hypothetical protein